MKLRKGWKKDKNPVAKFSRLQQKAYVFRPLKGKGSYSRTRDNEGEPPDIGREFDQEMDD